MRNVSAYSRGDQSSGGRNDMSPIENVSRRRFLTGGIIAAGALVLGVRYYSRISSGDKLPHDTNADHATLHPSAYLGIEPDGTVWIVASRLATADTVTRIRTDRTRYAHSTTQCARREQRHDSC